MHMHARVSRIDPAERGAPDLDRKRHVAGALELRADKQRTAESECRVEIELRRLQLRVELCRAIGRGKRVAESPRHWSTIEFRSEAVNRNSVAGKRDVAMQT